MYKEIIDWIDIFLVPAYFSFFLLILLWIKKRNPNNILIQKYLVKGFIFKVACAIFYGLLINFYYGFGDSLTYFRDAIFLKHQITVGAETIHVLGGDYKTIVETHGIIGGGGPQGLAIEKLSLVLSYISFSRYLVVTLFFCAIAYSGMFKMLQTFYDIMPEWHKRLALIVLFFPSISVFGSGILKDTICMAALGWLLYSGHQLFVKKHFSLKYILILLISAAIISYIKIYILAAFIIPYILYLLILLVKKIQNGFMRRVILPLLIVIVVGLYVANAERIDDMLGSYAVEKLFDTIKDQQTSYLSGEDAEAGGVFDLGSFEPNLSGFLAKMPSGIVASIYRPFIWESKKFIIVFSAVESLFLLWLTLYVPYKTGIRRFITGIFNNPFTFLCISYALLFGGLIGLSTFNFGTLARYRIPLIPFYTVGLLNILYNYQKTNRQKPLQNIPVSQ
ncbi:MAG: hypothetical protein ABIO04_02830 [Ferruginibacter sp.]